MKINIDTEILEIQILSNNLLKELKAYNKDLKSDDEYINKFWCSNKHKASFNRLRLELNNRFVELSKKFKEQDNDRE